MLPPREKQQSGSARKKLIAAGWQGGAPAGNARNTQKYDYSGLRGLSARRRSRRVRGVALKILFTPPRALPPPRSRYASRMKARIEDTDSVTVVLASRQWSTPHAQRTQ